MSVVSSFLAKATTLLSGVSVPVTFGEASITSALPFCVIEDRGTVPEYVFGFSDVVGDNGNDGVEKTTLTVTVYAVTLADVDTYVLRLKYFTGTPTDGLGLDFGTLTGLGSYLTFLSCRRTNEVRSRESQSYTTAAQIAHKCVLTYEVETQITDAP